MWTRKMIIDGSFVIGSSSETLSYSNFHIKLTLKFADERQITLSPHLY